MVADWGVEAPRNQEPQEPQEPRPTARISASSWLQDTARGPGREVGQAISLTFTFRFVKLRGEDHSHIARNIRVGWKCTQVPTFFLQGCSMRKTWKPVQKPGGWSTANSWRLLKRHRHSGGMNLEDSSKKKLPNLKNLSNGSRFIQTSKKTTQKKEELPIETKNSRTSTEVLSIKLSVSGSPCRARWKDRRSTEAGRRHAVGDGNGLVMEGKTNAITCHNHPQSVPKKPPNEKKFSVECEDVSCYPQNHG